MPPFDPLHAVPVFSDSEQPVAKAGTTPTTTTPTAADVQPLDQLPPRRPLARRALCDCGSRLETSAERHYRRCWWCLRLEC